MKRTFLLSSLLMMAMASQAQNNTKLYALTGDAPGSVQWTSVQELDPQSGRATNLIFKRNQNMQASIIDARTKQNLRNLNVEAEPTSTMAAASAYDAATNRLYFTPLHGTQLRYFDLNAATPTVAYVQTAPLRNFTASAGEADNITRMTMGSDGYGYALTNDGNHLIRFSTGNNVVINDLGPLKDAPANGSTSIHNQCSSWGGDMVADAQGNLYVFTVRGMVYKVNPSTMMAELKGQVKGLANGYTINGAAVNADGNVVVSSSVSTERYYSVDMNGLVATAITAPEGGVPNASDLASSALLFSQAPIAVTGLTMEPGGISVFPNPVTAGTARVQLDMVKDGLYQVELLNANGQVVYGTQANVEGKFRQIPLNFGKKILPGLYTVRVIGREGRQVHSERIVVQ